MSNESVALTVAVLTKNEAANIEQCLVSLVPAGQVVVVDSGSTDATCDVARSYGAVLLQQDWLGYARQRNWVLSRPELAHDWVFFVDADERVPSDAWEEIAVFLDRPTGVAGSFRRSVIFLGTELRHGGFGTARVTRLLRKGFAEYKDRPVHEHPLVDGRVHRFNARLLHDDQRPFEAWLDRHNRYSTLEAQARVNVERVRGRELPSGAAAKDLLRRTLWQRMPAKPVLFFLYVYVVRLGFLDGRAGFRIAILYAFQELCTQIKLEALRASLDAGAL